MLNLPNYQYCTVVDMIDNTNNDWRVYSIKQNWNIRLMSHDWLLRAILLDIICFALEIKSIRLTTIW